jgi:hypothetical protein
VKNRIQSLPFKCNLQALHREEGVDVKARPDAIDEDEDDEVGLCTLESS